MLMHVANEVGPNEKAINNLNKLVSNYKTKINKHEC